MEKPPIVSAEEFQRQRDDLMVAEKDATHALDALAAKRRRLPMVKFGEHVFDAPGGKRSLVDLFDGKDQLVVYQFMDNGPGNFCPGCTGFTNNVPPGALAILAERSVAWATISNMPLAQIEEYKQRMGWTLPFVSSRGTTFTDECGCTSFMLSVFLRDADAVYRTYYTTQRGVDRVLFSSDILDLVPYGRQENWEDSPAGWPQHPTYG